MSPSAKKTLPKNSPVAKTSAAQPSFFGDECEVAESWEIHDADSREVARVCLTQGVVQPLDYLVPESLTGRVVPGVRVEVPLGKSNRGCIGYCISVTRGMDFSTQRKLKLIAQLIDDEPLLTPDILRLAHQMADYYLVPLGQVLETVLPAGVRHHAGTRVVTIFTAVPEKKPVIPKTVESSNLGNQAAQRGGDMVEGEASYPPRFGAKKLSRQQQRVLETLRASETPLTRIELKRLASCSDAPITALVRLNLITSSSERRGKEISAAAVVAKTAPLALNVAQQQALAEILRPINEEKHTTILLHGVTGSGKTEVYIRAIEKIVERGKQAIVLVPEISLTPQTVARFASRFVSVAVLHSHLTDSERHHQWQRIKSGEVNVVVGARSAVFAPLPQIGLIVMDEEHENSFKQDILPRYHARWVAAERARAAQVPLILGSATPSLETYFAAEMGEIQKVSLPQRVLERAMPKVQIVDLREEWRAQSTSGAIHRELHLAMREALAREGQIILLLNRRGFATHIQCPACGEVLKCPHCDISLTHHKTDDLAICHYCDFSITPPRECPNCQFASVRYSGLGTQKLQQEIERRFPQSRILRMDADTMKGHGAHERALAQFRDGAFQILLGTQMIAKGLDFPRVTLVGVINADTAMHFPDFRAAERTFHLITQVAGRTGRGERGGKVIVQTSAPESLAIRAASRHDYARFVKEELPTRATLIYPPYAHMIRFVIRGENEQKTREFADALASLFTFATEENSLLLHGRKLGPAPAPIAKIRNLFRFHFQLISPDGVALRHYVREKIATIKTPEGIQWIVDVDPLDML